MTQPPTTDLPLLPPAYAARRRYRALLPTVLPALLLAILSTVLCRAAAGLSLGLFFGGVAFAALLVPPLATGEESFRRSLLVPAAVCAGTSIVWLFSLDEPLRYSQWLACSLVLIAWAFALGGLCTLLIAARLNAAIAAAAVTATALLWLTWPVWLSAALVGPAGESLVEWLVPAHPLFAINGVLSPPFDSWDRHPLAYGRLTVLNQDVFYAMPSTILWAFLLHATLAAATFGGARVLLGHRRARRN